MFERSRETIESVLEKTLFASRWLLAPFYLGLAVGIGILLIKFVQELFHLAQKAFVASESDAILGVLTLVDLALTGSLLLIVIFSGYENFVSKIDHSGHRDWPEWMGAIDFTALKIKLLGSIVAISAIQLLKQFMAVQDRVRPRADVVRDHPRRVRGVERAAGPVGPHRGRVEGAAKGGGRGSDRRKATPEGSGAVQRVLVLGGYGAFGGRVAERLAREPDVELIVAGRSLERARRACRTARSKGARAKIMPARLDADAYHGERAARRCGRCW